ncbi:MAG: prephenate dehydratase domain-containing protein, partial [Clostridia bacterium]|nr:prephenate dehydratase domain-containing protein [Clostridia bacterium]
MDIKMLRDEIDNIDTEIVKLFSERMNTAMKIASYKKENNIPVLNKEREREILNRVSTLAGTDIDRYARVLFSTLLDLSKSYQNNIFAEKSNLWDVIKEATEKSDSKLPASATIACQGVEGSYSSIACDKLFQSPKITYLNSFDGVFNAVDKGLCRYGILPIENSSVGSVGLVYDLMKKYNFYIVKSIKLRIEHTLLGKKGMKLADIREIYSHEQAINQCSEFLDTLKNVKVTICENTAAAAKMVANSDRKEIAAISSAGCAELYDLSIVSDKIQNSDNNYTRFICISKKLEIYAGANKISFMAAIPHKPGSLYNLMSKFAALGLNLTKLESRPIAGKDFEFMFYIDVMVSVLDEEVIRLIEDISKTTKQFSFLGGYSEVF